MSAHGTRPTWRKMPDLFPRGFCCHEAGHATVAFWLGIRVVAVSVIFTEERGWYGKTVTEGTPDLWENQIMLLMAGKAAEKVFNCSADRAWLHDAGTVDSLLDRMGMTREEREARIDRARTVPASLWRAIASKRLGWSPISSNTATLRSRSSCG
jgi:hypothetical protein